MLRKNRTNHHNVFRITTSCILLIGLGENRKGVFYSSYGVKILTCLDADDRYSHVTEACQTLYSSCGITHQIVVDFEGLDDTLTTLHEENVYRLRQTVHTIRDTVISGAMQSIMLVEGKAVIANVLMKYNSVTNRILNYVTVSASFVELIF